MKQAIIAIKNHELRSTILSLIGGLATLICLERTSFMFMDVRQFGQLGTPNVLAGMVAAGAAAYLLLTEQRSSYRYASVIMLTILVTCLFLWLTVTP